MSSIDKINVGGVDFDITSSPTPVMAPVETGTTATQAYAVGDYVIVGSTLHEVIAAIAIGDTFTEGINISTSTSLGDEIKEVKEDLTDAITELREEIESMGTVLIGSYDTVKSIDISEFNDTNASHYLAVQIADGEQSSRTYSDPNGAWQSYGYAYAYKPTITIGGNTLTFTPARVRAKSHYDNSSYMMTSLYYVGKISQ